MSSANAFNMVWSKILSCWNGLKKRTVYFCTRNPLDLGDSQHAHQGAPRDNTKEQVSPYAGTRDQRRPINH